MSNTEQAVSKPAPHTRVLISAAAWPECDICQMTGKPPASAYADVNIPTMSTWGNVCKYHFDLHHCRLGEGFGQQYVLIEPCTPEQQEATQTERIKEAIKDIDFSDPDMTYKDFEDLFEDRDPFEFL
jgi:hypothetical protein